MMTSSSEDKDELNEYENHRCISTLKIPKNLFALPKLQKTVRIIIIYLHIRICLAL